MIELKIRKERAMLYSQELIEEIRVQNDIVDVISEYIPLKQKGSSYFGLCPFHNESTPSFSVSPDKQLYYCFGCGVAGNVYSFIMQIENCDFLEAIKRLADRANISLPEPELSNEAKEAESLRQSILEIHKVAGLFYYSKLHEDEGSVARQYIKKRLINDVIQKKFGLGYSPDSGDKLYKHLKEKGFSQESILKSGLVLPSKNGKGYYDRFRGRLMFPIFDSQGRCIGFGGRILDKGEPKYLNSPETMVFNKSKNLYGLNFAKAARKKEMILVEGYMDMITIYQAGFHNVVASLGTAFNNEHARVLKKFAEDIILLFDSDEAGTNAILRAIPVLISNGFRVKVMQVPGGKDPDEFIKANGSKEFAKLLVSADSYITFQINCIRKKYNLENTEHKVIFTTEAAKILANIDSAIERDAYIKDVSKYTDISEDAIRNEIFKIRKFDESQFIKSSEKKKINMYSQSSPIEEFKNSSGVLEAQRNLLYICTTNLGVYKKVSKVLKPSDFCEPVYQKMASVIYDILEKGENIFPAEMVNYFQSIEEQKLATEVFSKNIKFDDIIMLEKAVNEQVRFIKKVKLDSLAASLTTVEDIHMIINEKKKVDELYINITDG